MAIPFPKTLLGAIQAEATRQGLSDWRWAAAIALAESLGPPTTATLGRAIYNALGDNFVTCQPFSCPNRDETCAQLELMRGATAAGAVPHAIGPFQYRVDGAGQCFLPTEIFHHLWQASNGVTATRVCRGELPGTCPFRAYTNSTNARDWYAFIVRLGLEAAPDDQFIGDYPTPVPVPPGSTRLAVWREIIGLTVAPPPPPTCFPPFVVIAHVESTNPALAVDSNPALVSCADPTGSALALTYTSTPAPSSPIRVPPGTSVIIDATVTNIGNAPADAVTVDADGQMAPLGTLAPGQAAAARFTLTPTLPFQIYELEATAVAAPAVSTPIPVEVTEAVPAGGGGVPLVIVGALAFGAFLMARQSPAAAQPAPGRTHAYAQQQLGYPGGERAAREFIEEAERVLPFARPDRQEELRREIAAARAYLQQPPMRTTYHVPVRRS